MNKIWIKDGSFSALKAEEIKGLSEEQAVEYYGDLSAFKDEETNGLKSSIKELSENSEENAETLKTLSTELKEALKVQAETTKSHGIALAKMAKSYGVTPAQTKTIKSLLAEKAEEIKSIRDKAVSIEVKASQVPGDIGDRDDLAQRIPGVEQLARRATFVRDFIRTIPTNTEYVRKTEQDVVVRDAKNVAACAASTHTTKLTWKQTTLQQKKVRDFVHICIDMMDDYDFVEGEVRDLIAYGVASQVDSQLLLGDGTGANINGIASYASTFSAALAGADYSAATGNPIQTPNVGDLICVAGAQIEFLGQHNKFVPNVAFLNPKQIKLLKLKKDKNDQYLLPNWLTTNGDEVSQIRLVGNPLVAENEAYVMDSTKAVIYSAKAATVDMSFENNDNFETETVTVKGYERLNLWVSANNSNAFMHIPSISAAITAITAP